jgi:hypothetical protein
MGILFIYDWAVCFFTVSVILHCIYLASEYHQSGRFRLNSERREKKTNQNLHFISGWLTTCTGTGTHTKLFNAYRNYRYRYIKLILPNFTHSELLRSGSFGLAKGNPCYKFVRSVRILLFQILAIEDILFLMRNSPVKIQRLVKYLKTKVRISFFKDILARTYKIDNFTIFFRISERKQN